MRILWGKSANKSFRGNKAQKNRADAERKQLWRPAVALEWQLREEKLLLPQKPHQGLNRFRLL